MLDHGQTSNVWVVGLNSHVVNEVLIQSVKRRPDIRFGHQRRGLVSLMVMACLSVVRDD